MLVDANRIFIVIYIVVIPLTTIWIQAPIGRKCHCDKAPGPAQNLHGAPERNLALGGLCFC